MNKINKLFLYTLNYFKLSTKRLFLNKNLVFNLKQLMCNKTYIKLIGSNSKIILGISTFTRPGVTMIAQNGTIEIGDNNFFNMNCCITSLEEVKIGDNCSFGPNVMIFDHDHNYKRKTAKEDEFVCTPVKIGDNVWVGANVVVLRGTTIGNNCVIGAGTVIKGNIADSTLVYSKNELVYKPILK